MGKKRDTLGGVEAEGEHAGDEDTLPDAFGTVMA